MKNIIFPIAFLLLFSSCSWKEHFIINNASLIETTVTYKLIDKQNGFPIFSTEPRLYKLNRSNEIDWAKEIKAVDLDSSVSGYQIKIPAAHTLIFGELSNDHYTSYNQTFINDRFFNLVELTVSTEKLNIHIVPSNFDKNFKKVSGNIQLEIK